MIYLFISRDEKEYDRYLAGAKDRGFINDKLKVSVSSGGASRKDSARTKYGKMNEVIAEEPKVFFHWRTVDGGQDGDRIFVVNAKMPIDLWKTDLRDGDESKRKESAKSILELLPALEKVAGLSVDANDLVSLFIHFGDNATPRDLEKPIEEAFKAVAGEREISVYAVSTTRCELFDVDINRKKPITVPITREELDALARRFQAERNRNKVELQWSDLKGLGVKCPPELTESVLKTLKGKGDPSITDEVIKAIDEQSRPDCFLGMLRGYLQLSQSAHGHTGLIDPRKGTEDAILKECVNPDTTDETAKELRARIAGSPLAGDNLKKYGQLLHAIYPELFRKLQEAVKNKNLGDLVKIYREDIPEDGGSLVKCLTPSGKLKILLIDDEDPVAELKNCDSFKVDALKVSGTKAEIAELVRKKFRRARSDHVSYDLILIDLCLSSNHQLDPEGYGMIRLAKNFCPGTPIVIYSQYDDMGHISRAFREGASWFLKKGEEKKLPRHVLKILEHTEWLSEWNGATPIPEFVLLNPVDEEFGKQMKNPAWRYLTWKCLEGFAGNTIFVDKMGGGLSGSVTFKACKGVTVGGIPLQTPNIIKIDDQFHMMDEYERYTRFIRPYMANEAGRIERPELAINRENAAIVYTYTGKQDEAHDLQAMSGLVGKDLESRSTCDYERYRFVVDHLFNEILPKIHRIAPDLEFKKDISDQCVTRPFGSNAFDPEEGWDNLKQTTFPNAYFDEYLPAEFYKSYRTRYYPWYKLELKDGADFKGENEASYKLAFHAVREDKKTEKYYIEAHDDDGYLCRICGDKADFVARYRGHIYPGDFLRIWGQTEKVASKDYLKEWVDEVCTREKLLAKYKNEHRVKACFVACANGMSKDVELLKAGFLSGYAMLQNELDSLAKQAAQNAKKYECKCPVGIVHGDLNLNNVMLEALKHAPKEKAPDVTSTVTDAWLIDFARTRRDLIAHDFNVFFTSVLGELLSRYDIDNTSGGEYRRLEENFAVLIRESVFGKAESLRAVPDALQSDERLTLVWKLLYRCRQAAIESGISENMYILTTALGCMVAQRIFFEKGEIVKSAGFFTAAAICRDEFAARITPKKTAP